MLPDSGFLLRHVILAFIAASAGSMIAAGVVAFLVMIGVIPRLIGKTGTQCHTRFFETAIVLGGVAGNLLILYKPSMPLGSNLILGVFGLMAGVFVGCLVMSLAETLKALPVINRRIHLAVGLQYVIVSFGIGKLVGAFIYFVRGMGLS